MHCSREVVGPAAQRGAPVIMEGNEGYITGVGVVAAEAEVKSTLCKGCCACPWEGRPEGSRAILGWTAVEPGDCSVIGGRRPVAGRSSSCARAYGGGKGEGSVSELQKMVKRRGLPRQLHPFF